MDRADTPIDALSPASASDQARPSGPELGQWLLPLALSQPRQAQAIAFSLLDGSSRSASDLSAYDRSIAQHTIGIVLRDEGRYAEAVDHLTQALQAARRSRDDARIADVLASLGVALVGWGRTAAGLKRLDHALELSTGVDRARVRLRRANVLLVLGRPEQALTELRTALRVARTAGDTLWQARCLVNRSWAHATLGAVARADADAEAAERLFTAVGQRREAALAVHNRGGIAFLLGDIPHALELLHEAERRYADVGSVPAELVHERAHVLLAAGLAPEADADAAAALTDPELSPVSRAELLLVQASCSLTMGDPRTAAERARQARSLFAGQHRDSWVTHADFIAVQAGLELGPSDPSTLRSVRSLAARLERQHSPEASLAHVLAGRLARSLGRDDVAASCLVAAAGRRRNGPALGRATGWLAMALLADQSGHRRGVFTACARGLDALEEHRLSFGDVELRALATEHSRELSRLAMAAAFETGRPRVVLTWSERLRATVFSSPPAVPVHDPELLQSLAAARHATRRLAEESDEPGMRELAERDRHRYEAQVSRHYRRLRGNSTSAGLLDVPALVAATGDDAVVSLVDAGGVLHAIVVHAGRVARTPIGPTSRAVAEAEHARFALRRVAYGRRADLARAGVALQQAVLGEIGSRLPERVALVPPAALHTVPWGMLPALAESAAAVVPCARMWLETRTRPAPPDGRVVLVSGPRLSTEAEEVGRLRTLHPRTVQLTDAQATVAATVDHLNGAAVAHVAAHGTFRSDAPMFSSLLLADGPLFVHDLDRLQHAPHTLVLSACDAGGSEAVGVDEGLGMVTTLLGLGTSSILASVVKVNDEATMGVMESLHTGLAAGLDLATAWRDARVAATGDPALRGAAAAFNVWGAGTAPCRPTAGHPPETARRLSRRE